MRKSYQSWGGIKSESHSCGLSEFATTSAIEYLPFGMGRSYGDVCLNDGGSIIEMRYQNKFIQFDRNLGTLECEGGVTLDKILELIVPNGWFLPTSPGTKFITLGGAIANDIHGKNHHRVGTLGNHIESLYLKRSSGEEIHCSNSQNEELFQATVGGMGLTGIIVSAKIKLSKIPSSLIKQKCIKFNNFDEFFTISDLNDKQFEHTVAWLDCTSKGKNLGRGIYMGGNWYEKEDSYKIHNDSGPRVPFTMPNWFLGNLTVRAFNFCYFHKQRKKSQEAIVHYNSFFYPLDKISCWNKLYGKKGFYQYQCVIPKANAKPALKKLLEIIAHSGDPSFLVVLKKFGSCKSVGMLSFPKEGLTLALDFRKRGYRTLELFKKLDKIVKENRGRLYPAKDSLMNQRDFNEYYDNFEKFKTYVDPSISSNYWKRIQ